jgi:integral membrane protein
VIALPGLFSEMLFTIVAYAEVVSYLVLLAVAVPLKYMAAEPRGVAVIGPIHGVLFSLYCAMVLWRSSQEQWSLGETGRALLAGILPLGPIGVVRKGSKP